MFAFAITCIHAIANNNTENKVMPKCKLNGDEWINKCKQFGHLRSVYISHLILIEEHSKLSDADSKICFVELIRYVPS